MPRAKSEGTCKFCGGHYSKGSMSRHLEACRQKHDEKAGKSSQKVRSFHIVVEGSPQHWLHLEASAEATLAHLDALLRATWLECCGHLSAFEIGRTLYSVAPDPDMMGFGGVEETDMKARLSDVLQTGVKFTHDYDFGSTTQCRLRVTAEHELPLKKHEINVEARNDPPEIPFMECGQPAVVVCTDCMWEGESGLCRKCAKKHECGDEMFLPVVNSPRMGVCGYSG